MFKKSGDLKRGGFCMANLVPRSFRSMPVYPLPSTFDEVEELLSQGPSGAVGISEDNKNIYVDVAIPGVDPDDIEVTYQQGILWVRGEAREEAKSVSEFSYRIAIPGEINQNAHPKAECKNGIVRVILSKE